MIQRKGFYIYLQAYLIKVYLRCLFCIEVNQQLMYNFLIGQSLSKMFVLLCQAECIYLFQIRYQGTILHNSGNHVWKKNVFETHEQELTVRHVLSFLQTSDFYSTLKKAQVRTHCIISFLKIIKTFMKSQVSKVQTKELCPTGNSYYYLISGVERNLSNYAHLIINLPWEALECQLDQVSKPDKQLTE